MTTKIEVLWKESLRHAQTNPIEPNGYRLNRITPESRFGIYAGVDSSSFLLLAICINFRPPNIATESTSLDYFRQQRKDGTWFMVLRLRQGGLETVFGRLCQDLVDAAEGMPDEKALVALFRDRLYLWKKLFQQGGRGLLQINQIKGLIAEMLVLEALIDRGEMSLEEAVSGWIGPAGADQDFLYSDQAFEVKAFALGAETISISSLKQLDCNVPLHLITLTMRQASTGDHNASSLNSIVARIEGKIAASPEALNVFRERLLEACYVDNDFYDTVLFEAAERTIYSVIDDFPKLTSATVASGVVGATYSISIEAISSFKSDMSL